MIRHQNVRRGLCGVLALLAAVLLYTHPSHAQLRSQGSVPDDLKQSVQQLYDAYLQRAKDYTGERVRERQQLMEASYYINKMLANGHIIYGDPISRMVGRIADTLLVDYPELRAELRFYTVTSPDVNAFATPQGMVFVNTGLVAQVENEAQLAFILSHEIVHYYRSHGMEELVGKDGKKRRNGDELDDEAERVGDLLRRHNRSREMENEADSLGIAMFYLQSPYAKDVSEGVFDVLQYGELPFDELPFDTSYFNTPYFKLTGCWLDSVADITSRDNYDDSRSTHPNILTRRGRTAATLDGYYGGEKYVMTTKSEFEQLRHTARIECIRQDLLHGQYPRALYNSWVILKSTPDDAQLQRYLVQALYGAATFKNHDKQTEVLPDYKKVEGESQQVYYALRKMTNTQATVVALHKAWEMHIKYPDEPAYEAICADLMEQMRLKLGMSSPDFLAEPPRAADTTAVTSADEEKGPEKAKTKYERIKQKRQTQTERKPVSYALTDLMMADATLLPTLRSHLNGNAPKDAPLTDAAEDTSAMLVFNPCYWVVDNKKEDLLITQSMHQEEDLTDRLSSMARRFHRRTVDFSDNGMHEMTEADQYNDFLSICEWMNEFWLTKGTFELERTMQPIMDDLLYRYGARTLNMTAVLNTHGTSPEVSLGYIIILPFAPVIIPMAFTGIEQTAMVSMVIDARKGKVLARQKYNYDVADHNDMVDAMLYDTYVRALKDKGKEPVGCFGHRVAIAGGLNVGASGYQTFKQINKYLDYTPWVSVEVALKRSLSLAATVRYHHGYEGVTQSMTEWVETSYGYYTSRDVTFPSSRNMLIVGLELRDYKESDFAPLGYYIDYGAQWVHFTTLDGTPGTNGNNTFGLHIGIGRNYTFFQRLLLNWQVDYAYTYGLHKTVDFDFSGKYINYLHYADAILSNVITVKLGIGFIPF